MERALALRGSSALNATASSVRISQQSNRLMKMPSVAFLQRKCCEIRNKEGIFHPKKTAMVGKSGRWTICASKGEATISKPIAPLQPESPSGQFLAEILQSHPHLFSAAAEQQLERLAEARVAASSQERLSITGSELVLYKRMAELRAREMRKTVEDIIYALISQRFVEARISFVPSMSASSASGEDKVDDWPPQDKELEAAHSKEVFELIREHLAIVLGGRVMSDDFDHNALAQISKLRLGRVYAASAVYGYFLRRIDQRFQLEKAMKVLPPGLVEVEQVEGGDQSTGPEGGSIIADIVPEVTALVLRDELKEDPEYLKQTDKVVKCGRLRSYVMSFGAEMLHRYATVRSKESVSVIERHTEALFGKPELQISRNGSMAIAKDELIMLSFFALRRLVLEAVAFGSFLWDVETYVDSQYHIVAK